jgi:hypothetical protein
MFVNNIQPAPSWTGFETINDHQKHLTFSVKTSNFVMRIDNVLSVTVHP